MSFICTNTSVCTQNFAVIICTVTLVPSAKRTVWAGCWKLRDGTFYHNGVENAALRFMLAAWLAAGTLAEPSKSKIQFACHNSTCTLLCAVCSMYPAELVLLSFSIAILNKGAHLSIRAISTRPCIKLSV